MGSCSYYVDASGARIDVEDSTRLPEGASKVTRKTFALDGFEPREVLSWMTLAAFLWPAAAVAAFARRPRGRGSLMLRVLEVPLLALSVGVVDFVSTFLVDRRAIGAWAAFLALGLYLAGAVIDDVVAYRSWRGRRKRSTSP